MTIREAISRIKNTLKSIKRDERISNQYVYSVLNSVAQLLIKQDSKNKKLFQNLTNLTIYECVKLEDVDLNNCSGIIVNSCNSIKQSSLKFPSPYYSFTNKPLIYISGIDDSEEMIATSPFEYAQYKKGEFKGKKKYYWFENNKIIVPDSELEFIKVRGYFQEDMEYEKTFLDQTFNIPEYLQKDLFKLALEEIFTFNKRINSDDNTNLNNKT